MTDPSRRRGVANVFRTRFRSVKRVRLNVFGRLVPGYDFAFETEITVRDEYGEPLPRPVLQTVAVKLCWDDGNAFETALASLRGFWVTRVLKETGILPVVMGWRRLAKPHNRRRNVYRMEGV